jgi:hypothetical protein
MRLATDSLRRLAGAALAASAALLIATSPAHAGWLAPHDIPVGPSHKAGGTAIAPDGTVTTVAVDGAALKAAVKPPGQPFQAPVVIAPITGMPLDIVTRSDRAGNVVVVWDQDVNGTRVVRATSKAVGGAFAPAQTLSDSGSYAFNARVAIAGGKVVAVWMQNQRVRLATAAAGGAFTVHDPLTQAVGENMAPAVAAAPDGSALVAWRKYTSTTVTVQVAARAAGGTAFTPLPDAGSRPKTPGIADVQAAMGPSGRATLVWTYYTGSNIGAQAASRGKTGAFGPVQTLDEWFGGPYAALVMGDDDTALLAWSDNRSASYALRPLGGGFQPTRSVDLSIVNSSIPIQAGFAADGSARLVWISDAGSRPSVRTSRIAPDGTNDGEQIIAAPVVPPGQTDSIGRFGLAVREGGDAAVSWNQSYDADFGPGTDIRRRIRTAILDVTPPVVSAVQVSGLPLMGKPLTMHVTTSDALSGATAIWDFGDGTTEEGETLTKVYAEPGSYLVRVTVSDDAGNTASRVRVQPIHEYVPPL